MVSTANLHLYTTAGKALAKLADERVELQRERNMLKTSLADKARVENELRSEMASKAVTAESNKQQTQGMLQSASTSSDEVGRCMLTSISLTPR